MAHALLEQIALLILCYLLLNRYELRCVNPTPIRHALCTGCVLGVGAWLLTIPALGTAPSSLNGTPVIASMVGLFNGWAALIALALIKSIELISNEHQLIAEPLIVLSVSGAAGLLYRALYQHHYVGITTRVLLLFGVALDAVLLIVHILCAPIDSEQYWWPLPKNLLLLGVTPAAIVILGLLLNEQRQRQYAPKTRETEGYLYAICRALPDLLFSFNAQGQHQWLNPPTSATSQEHNPHAPPLPPQEQLNALIQQSLSSHKTQYLSYRLPGASEGVRYFEGRAQRVPMSAHTAQQADHLIMLIRETTQQVQSESELRIAAIAFESRQGMVITDPEGHILRVNQAFCRITGFSAQEVIGQNTRILRSGENSYGLYQSMWQDILKYGSWQGEIKNRRKTGETYPAWLSISAVRDTEGKITHYVAAQTDISAHKAAEHQIHHLAFYDPLTGLPNRRLLLERLLLALTNAANDRHFGAVMMFDLDNFKNINDLHGHPVGDQFLCEVASRLSEHVRPSDTVARLGGDEFIIVLTGFTANRQEAQQQVTALGQRILACLRQPYHLEDLILHSSASIGAVLFRDAISDDIQREAEELIRHADISMYEAKIAGKNSLRFFDPVMQEALNQRLSLETDLRRALERDEFLLNFQPQFDQDWRLIGAETLVRWQHPSQGMVLPKVFIETAKRAGLAPELDIQVLQKVCQQLAQWANHPQLSELVIAVNLSASLLYRSDFVDRLLQILEDNNANPQRLKLEITESLLLDDMPRASEHMHALRQAGIRFSIDDFGTGYSSMIYLHRLPLDQLKIDQTFVQSLSEDPSSLAIIRAICALANSLDLDVLAEGVESVAQIQSLSQLGCQHFQGYLLGHPVSAPEFERLTQHQAWPAQQLESAA